MTKTQQWLLSSLITFIAAALTAITPALADMSATPETYAIIMVAVRAGVKAVLEMAFDTSSR